MEGGRERGREQAGTKGMREGGRELNQLIIYEDKWSYVHIPMQTQQLHEHHH